VNLTYILLAYSALFILGIIDNSRGPIYPELLNLFSITKTQGSLIFSLASLSGFFISVFSQRWLKLFGVFKATQIALVLDVFACIVMGTVSAGHFGYYQFLTAAIILGLSMGIKGITLNLMINYASPVKKRRQIFSGLHAMYGVASLGAPLIFGFLFKFNIDWRNYFVFLALIPFCVLLYSFKSAKKIQVDNKSYISGPWSLKSTLLSAIFVFYVASEILISSRLVIYLNEIQNFSMDDASYSLSGFFFFLLLGRTLIALKSINLRSIVMLKCSLVFSLVFTVIGLKWYPPLLVLNGLSMSLFFPTGMDWLSQISHKQADHIISKVMISIGGGLVLMHYGFGLMSDILGLAYSIWIVPIMLILSLSLLQLSEKKFALN
jgi:fucose permease